MKTKERTLVEGIHGTWHYHLSDDGKTALCGAMVMISSAPESTWGFVGHLNERYCKKCEEIRPPRLAPPFPGVPTKPSIIPKMIKLLKKHGMKWEHLLPAILIVLSASAYAQSRYTLQDLGPGLAYGINRVGDVCGFYVPAGSPQGTYAAFLYSKGKLKGLGTGWASVAYALNDLDEVVGLTGENAFLWKRIPGGSTAGAIMQGGAATGINDNGEVVGQSTGSGQTDAFMWINQKPSYLGGFSTNGSLVYGINNAGTIVGQSAGRAIMFLNGGLMSIDPHPGVANAINQHGHITGSIDGYSPFTQAFLYAGRLTVLPVLPNTVNAIGVAINDSDIIVGYCASADWFEDTVFVYEHGKTYNLTNLLVTKGWTVQYAAGINDVGEIVGSASKADGVSHAVILKPVK